MDIHINIFLTKVYHLFKVTTNTFDAFKIVNAALFSHLHFHMYMLYHFPR